MTRNRSSSFHRAGLTQVEADVMDLWDDDVPMQIIADRLGIDRKRVQKIILCYGINGNDRWESSARRSGDALLDALRRHYPERCGGVA